MQTAKVEAYLTAEEGERGPSPMEVGAIDHGKKGGGKGGWKGGQGASKGQGSWRPTGSFFNGYCSWCLAYGHKRADCWWEKPGKGAKGHAIRT